MQGIIKNWNSVKGYGFIIGEGEQEVFLHYSNIIACRKNEEFTVGDKVSFDVETTSIGLNALNARLI